jgi:pSer/pThr/pTyr-binding forkhead associated (FHA) protein
MAVKCPNCASAQLDGTIFCLECGASLMTDSATESTREIGAPAGPMTAGLSAKSGSVGQSQQLTLIVVHTGQRLLLAVEDELLVGRADANKGITPDIDLGPQGGLEAGVSRRHAILAHRSGDYQIEDLGSANGTFVNGRRLAPQAAVSLRSGDEVKCGMLVLRVEFGA